MKSGDVFVLDAVALVELASFSNTSVDALTKKINVGDTFSISKQESCKGDVISASRWTDGKPSKGRPRSFPRATVVRLLGVTDDQGATTEVEFQPEVAETEESVEALVSQAEELTQQALSSLDQDDSW